MYELKPIADSVAKLTKESFSRKFVSLSRILTQWNDIVGEEMAGKCQPMKLNYRKPKAANEKPVATLEIAVSSADSTALHYQKDLILARINHLFGDDWVTGIKFTHHAPALKSKTQPNPRNKILTSQDLSRLQEMIDGIEDEEIKKRLERLGQGVLSKPRS